jgi:hypothetical protein
MFITAQSDFFAIYIRPPNPFDAAQGKYHRKSIGDIVEGEMVLNEWAASCKNGENLPRHFPGIKTGAFDIVPNHAHGIIVITAGRSAVPAPNLDDATFWGRDVLGLEPTTW